MKTAALFLDRDDTIVYDESYMSRPEQIRLLPGVADALQQAATHFRLYLLTNQSGIGRGFYTLEDAQACNARMLQLLDLPAPGFHGICIAPEAPDQPAQYRKPSPAYILETIARDALDPAQCWMIGDKISDLACGMNAGITPILVGKGCEALREDAAAYAKSHGIATFASLPEAINALVK